MTSRRVLETAGVFTIAAALHVSAAVMLLPQEAQRGAGAAPVPAQLAAGGQAMEEMVATWEAPPEIATPAPPPPPAAVAEAPPLVVAAAPPTVAPPAMPAPALPRPDAGAALPNLPPPPEAEPEAAPEERAESRLALEASSRPQARPERRAPPAPAPQREARPRDPAPAEARQGDRDQRAQQAGQGGSAAQSRQAAGGGGGSAASAAQRDSAMAQWSARIQSCIGRRASAPRNARGQGTVLLSLTVGRDGAIRGVGIAGSSGNAAMDQAAVTAAQRAGRCPAAPAALTEAAYPFHLPITLR